MNGSPYKYTFHCSIEYICLDCGKFLKGDIEIKTKTYKEIHLPIMTCKYCGSSADKVQRIG